MKQLLLPFVMTDHNKESISSPPKKETGVQQSLHSPSPEPSLLSAVPTETSVQTKPLPTSAALRAEDPLAGTSWLKNVPYFAQGKHLALLEKVAQRRRSQQQPIYPAQENLLRAYRCTPFDDVRVIILGQDPYHGPGQAHGLCFSVPKGIPAPRSLCNIFGEIVRDVYSGVRPDFWKDAGGDLTRWAQQGVLLLNVVGSVDAGAAGSHASMGWEELTRAALTALGQRQHPIAVLMWGNWARQFAPLFGNTSNGHLLLFAAHPSPLSASKGFFGCQHFSRVNAWLQGRGEKEIAW